MKKTIIFAAALAVLAACSTTDFRTDTVGWADSVDVAVKDFVSVGIVTLEAREVVSTGPLYLFTEHSGGRITHAALFAEAAKLGADDIMNVRIDIKTEEKATFFDWLTGSSTTYVYTGTALAIKYTTAVERVKIVEHKESGL
ncbi:MAG: lipoprotein [Spirochaetaceae bacterium]|nr:lipoprotein [Spirochaetaceae bacterium]